MAQLVVEVWRTKDGKVAKIHRSALVTYVSATGERTVTYAKPGRPPYADAQENLTKQGYRWYCNQYESEEPKLGTTTL